MIYEDLLKITLDIKPCCICGYKNPHVPQTVLICPVCGETFCSEKCFCSVQHAHSDILEFPKVEKKFSCTQKWIVDGTLISYNRSFNSKDEAIKWAREVVPITHAYGELVQLTRIGYEINTFKTLEEMLART